MSAGPGPEEMEATPTVVADAGYRSEKEKSSSAMIDPTADATTPIKVVVADPWIMLGNPQLIDGSVEVETDPSDPITGGISIFKKNKRTIKHEIWEGGPHLYILFTEKDWEAEDFINEHWPLVDRSRPQDHQQDEDEDPQEEDSPIVHLDGGAEVRKKRSRNRRPPPLEEVGEGEATEERIGTEVGEVDPTTTTSRRGGAGAREFTLNVFTDKRGNQVVPGTLAIGG